MASGRVPKTSITVFINICLYFRGFCITKHLQHLRKKCLDVFPYNMENNALNGNTPLHF